MLVIVPLIGRTKIKISLPCKCCRVAVSLVTYKALKRASHIVIQIKSGDSLSSLPGWMKYYLDRTEYVICERRLK